MQDKTEQPFWRVKALEEMSKDEWESLCDGCGKCCLNKLADEDGAVFYTNVACRLLDTEKVTCKRYAVRFRLVSDCVQLSAQSIRKMTWLPKTCAYAVLARGEDLADWHPLISGRAESVHEAGMSVRGRVVSEPDAGPLEHHLIDWIE